MKKTSKRVILLALLVLGVLMAICAYAEHEHVYEIVPEWGFNSTDHWIEYADKCNCGQKNPHPRPVQGPTPPKPHTLSERKYDKASGKDIVTCTENCGYSKKVAHKHKYSNTISKKFSKAVKLNASQHTSYYTVEKECACGETKKMTETTKNSHTMKVKSVERKPKQNLIVTTKCCSAYGCNHTTTSYDPIDPSKPWMTPQ